MNKKVKINETKWEIELIDKLSVDNCIKWHIYIMRNVERGCEFYTLKIIQHKGSKPFFLAERFEIVSGFAFSYDAEDYLYKHFYPEDAEMLEKLLIELSDKEIRGKLK